VGSAPHRASHTARTTHPAQLGADDPGSTARSGRQCAVTRS
jgi:hypothetical protein